MCSARWWLVTGNLVILPCRVSPCWTTDPQTELKTCQVVSPRQGRPGIWQVDIKHKMVTILTLRTVLQFGHWSIFTIFTTLLLLKTSSTYFSTIQESFKTVLFKHLAFCRERRLVRRLLWIFYINVKIEEHWQSSYNIWSLHTTPTPSHTHNTIA